LLLAALWFAGLGCAGGSTALPVEIELTLDGKPLPHAAVTLVPQDASGVAAVGNTDGEGVARPIAAGQSEGILPGHYKVIVIKMDDQNPGKLLAPSEYTDPSTTPLSVTVPPGGRVLLEIRGPG
jgi:hypothetical protein